MPLAMNVGLLGFVAEDDISVGTAELQDALNGSPPSHFTPPLVAPACRGLEPLGGGKLIRQKS